MVSQMTTLQAQPRQVLGKKVKTLRKAGITPIHLYGPDFESQALQTDAATLRRVLVHVGRNRPVSVQVDGNAQPNICFVRDIKFSPITVEVQHVDFLRVDVTQKLEFQVPVHIVNDAPAVRKGGILVQPVRELLVESLPLEAPAAIEVDISVLEDVGMSIRARDLKLPAGVTLVSDPEQVVIQANMPPRVVEETAPAAAAAEGEATTEGAAPAEEGQSREGQR